MLLCLSVADGTFYFKSTHNLPTTTLYLLGYIDITRKKYMSFAPTMYYILRGTYLPTSHCRLASSTDGWVSSLQWFLLYQTLYAELQYYRSLRDDGHNCILLCIHLAQGLKKAFQDPSTCIFTRTNRRDRK